MRRGRLLGPALAACLLSLPGSSAAQSADPAAAERQYRVARRLAADGSSEAAAALRKVVELDPQGPLADDAMLEEALLENLPRWPEELGRLAPPTADRALALLDRVVGRNGDRAEEARYYRGLLLLEPLPRHDAAAARMDLLALATHDEAGELRHDARYAVAWLAEQLGEQRRAGDAYHRLVVDAPATSAARRARIGLARLALREQRPGRAATWAQGAADLGDGETVAIAALKRLAVDGLRQPRGERHAGSVPAVVAQTTLRAPAGFATTPDGGIVLADRRQDFVVAYDASGNERGRWTLREPHAVGVGPWGGIHAAADGRIYRLADGRPPLDIASQGAYAPVSAMAVDGLGGIWLTDRRGESVARLAPGGVEPALLWQGKGRRLVAITWDGRRLVGVDGRARVLLSIDRDGAATELTSESFQRPVALASDLSGRLAVLDAKASSVMFFNAAGTATGVYSLAAAGIARPAALGVGADGSLHLFDESSGGWMKVP